MVAERRNSPLSGRPSTSSRTVCKRSPCATAAIARVTSVVGHSRSSINELIEPSISAQAPLNRPNFTRWRVLPSRPTTWPTRSSWVGIPSLAATISLKVSAILPIRPGWSPGIRTEKSPTRIACRARRRSLRSTAPLPFALLLTSSGTAETGAPLGLVSAISLRVGCIWVLREGPAVRLWEEYCGIPARIAQRQERDALPRRAFVPVGCYRRADQQSAAPMDKGRHEDQPRQAHSRHSPQRTGHLA